MHAVRNITLCTKDCLCLYVCPTGAADTETGQIDAKKCISGSRACVDACPAHAISLVPEEYPPQQEKTNAVVNALRELSASKAKQEKISNEIVQTSDSPFARQLAKAISMSNRIMAEDLLRESGFMLPQSKSVVNLLETLLEEKQLDDFPKDIVVKLIDSLEK